MVDQLKMAHGSAHTTALHLARQAEWCYAFELGIEMVSPFKFQFITDDIAWNNDLHGLSSGEKLVLGLKHMETAYLSANRREFEIAKQISLLQLNPLALIALRETGTCEFQIPEALFDLDFPGHFLRRIKSASLTIPCVAGPYASVNATLTLQLSSVRYSKDIVGTGYSDPMNPTTSYTPIDSIATSHAQNDSGLFELNFWDERYLPFEGAGVISSWKLELPNEFRQFDYNTISDIVLHLRYTARDGRDKLQEKASQALRDRLNTILNNASGAQGLAQVFSLRYDFPSEWHRFLTKAEDNGDHTQAFAISRSHFPYLFQGRTISIKRIDLLGVPKDGTPAVTVLPELTLPDVTSSASQNPDQTIGRLCHTKIDRVRLSPDADPARAAWKFKVGSAKIAEQLEPLDDILIICTYTVSEMSG